MGFALGFVVLVGIVGGLGILVDLLFGMFGELFGEVGVIVDWLVGWMIGLFGYLDGFGGWVIAVFGGCVNSFVADDLGCVAFR